MSLVPSPLPLVHVPILVVEESNVLLQFVTPIPRLVPSILMGVLPLASVAFVNVTDRVNHLALASSHVLLKLSLV